VSFAIVDAAAGSDARPGAHVGRSRYCMPIANVPLIYHVFDELAEAGIERVLVIVSTGARADIEHVLSGGRPWGLNVSFATAVESDCRATALAEIERALADEPVLVCPGDCLFPGQVSAMWERFRCGDVDAVVLGAGTGPGRRGSEAAAEVSSRVTLNPAIVGPAGAPFIHGLRSESLDHRDLADFLRTSERRVAICELGTHWHYSERTDELLTANRMLLDALPVPALDRDFGDNNVVHGRVAISASAHLSGCILHGPIVIDEFAVIEDSFVGPYSAIGAGAALRGAEIDNTMVLAGAEISHPGHRIEASIIGERASVVRSFSLPRGLHLRLEPHSRVTLS
jgi:glucose-1-phosphate thymidylyltransferase